jgi:ATP synthase protein I
VPGGVEALPADDHLMIERSKPDSLSDLEDRLRRMREQEQDNRPAGARDDIRGAVGIAMRIGVELVAAIGVGAGIGYLLDRWLDTAPWLLVVFFLLGSAAGMMNVYRVMNGMSQAVGYSAERRSADKVEKESADDTRGDGDDTPRKT